MGRLKSALPNAMTMKDVWNRVGRVPLERIRMNPPPGYATEKDVTAIQDREDRWTLTKRDGRLRLGSVNC